MTTESKKPKEVKKTGSKEYVAAIGFDSPKLGRVEIGDSVDVKGLEKSAEWMLDQGIVVEKED